MEERYCSECGSNTTELHHIIYKSQAKYLANIPINFKFLCPDHHRGNGSPHMSKKKDLQYKQELQAKLNIMFRKDYYNINEIKDILEISKSEAEKVVNKVTIFKEGYRKEDIIRRCLGGRMY
jgi:hypothetical protein